jgi:hypothetical protein
MKTRHPLLLALGLALALPAILRATDHDHPTIPAIGQDVLLDVTATIQAVNLETREVTLKGDSDRTFTITVDPRIKRLAEFKPGDKVEAQYYASVAAELRAPTEEEKTTPYLVLEDKAHAPADAHPAGGGLRVVRAVATIEGLDRTDGTVTVKGPKGNFATIKVQDPSRIEKLHIGDTLIITYTEAFAVSLVPLVADTSK